jgi:hypothetical protein
MGIAPPPRRIEGETMKSICLVLTPLEMEVLNLYLQKMDYEDIVASMNKNKRSKDRIDCLRVDNALCRIMRKIREIA